MAGVLPPADRKREREDLVDQQLKNEREGLVVIGGLGVSFYDTPNEDIPQTPIATGSRVQRLTIR